MMITNFSAGELSDTLFGRIDIPQYYSAASKLENFDVIPTGGIKRRGGTEKILSQLKDENGALILDRSGNPVVPVRVMPFIINRDESYLIIFADWKIIIYKAGEWDRAKKVLGDNDETFWAVYGSGRLYNKEEIPDVQCAQNQEILILVHQKCHPIKIEIKDDGISLEKLFIYSGINFEHSPGVVVNKQEYDDFFKDGRLTTEKNYPGCVSFYNGRLVFAATERDKQRLFFSHVNNINNFSTYKAFITEVKELVYIRCVIKKGSKTVYPTNHDESAKIKSPLSKKWFVETRFFPEDTYMTLEPTIMTYEEKEADEIIKKTKIIMEFSNEPNDNFGAGNEEIISDINAKIKAFNSKNEVNNMDTKENYSVYERIAEYANSNPQEYTRIHLKTGSSKFRVVESGGLYEEGEISKDMAIGIGQNDHSVLLNLAEEIKAACNRLKKKDPAAGTPNNPAQINNNITQAAQTWINKIIENSYFRYSHDDLEESYYGYLFEIKDQVINDTCKLELYIPMYTLDQIQDNHPTPDCGFTFEIASNTNDAIKWLAVNRGIIVGTEFSEWAIPPDVHAGNIQAIMLSMNGSGNIPGEVIGNATCFFQTGLKNLIEYYPNEYDHFRANNMAMLSPQMLSEKKVKEFDYTLSPYTKLIITREDEGKDNGDIVTLLYERGTGTFAWSRIVTNGSVKSAAVLPGADGNDELFIIVKRGSAYFLEVLKETADVYLDSYAPWNGDESGYDKDTAVIFDGTDGKKGVVYPLKETKRPAVSDKCFIGYPYTSFLRSMPVLANDKMKPNNVANLLIRFHDSFMPKLKEYEDKSGSTISVNWEPFTGVTKEMFPGGWAVDVIFDIYHDKPTRCKILSVYAEVR